jgi:hypothetical protein
MTDMPATTQEEITYCGVHEDREATLRCIRCERYMCTQCVVQTPVGYICRECARKHDDKFFNATNLDDVIVFSTCAILTGIGAAVVNALGIPIFFLLILGLPLGGGVVGEAALRLTKRRKGRYSHYIAAAGAVIGGLIGAFLQVYLMLSQTFNAEALEQIGTEAAAEISDSVFQIALNATVMNINVWLFVGIIAVAVYGRYRMRI